MGNSVEVEESLDCLRGGGARDLRDLVILQGAMLLTSAGMVETLDQGKERIAAVLDSGAALEKFKLMVIRQVRLLHGKSNLNLFHSRFFPIDIDSLV